MSKYFNENNIKIIDGDYKNALRNRLILLKE